MDRFPEAFKRFEEVVDVSKIKTFQQLKLAFQSWAGRKWKETPKQMLALEREAVRLELWVEVTPEEYYKQKRLVDWLYYRVRLDYWRVKHWESIWKTTEKWLKRLERYPDLYAKYGEPEKKRVLGKLENWREKHEQHFSELKRERERFRRMKLKRMG